MLYMIYLYPAFTILASAVVEDAFKTEALGPCLVPRKERVVTDIKRSFSLLEFPVLYSRSFTSVYTHTQTHTHTQPLGDFC